MYIYKTTCLINGKIYIGQCHLSLEISATYLGSGVLLKLAIKKYGRKNFKREILKCGIPNQKQLDIWEQVFIKRFDCCNPNIGYNLLAGTANGFGGGVPIKNPRIREYMLERQREAMKRPEVREALRQAQIRDYKKNPAKREKLSKIGKELTGDKNPNFGNKWSVEQKQAMSEKSKAWAGSGDKNPNFGKRWSDAQRESLSKKTKERFQKEPNPMTNKKRITNGKENRAISAETPIPEGWWFGLTMKPRQKI